MVDGCIAVNKVVGRGVGVTTVVGGCDAVVVGRTWWQCWVGVPLGQGGAGGADVRSSKATCVIKQGHDATCVHRGGASMHPWLPLPMARELHPLGTHTKQFGRRTWKLG